MKKLKISDALSGHVSISSNKRKYFKTKDSASPSGHSLLAQIDMTHSGIVTRNYGFYLPARMKAGASTFTKDYKKPVLIGHDEVTDTKPVGRVINAEYVDNSELYRNQDSHLNNLWQMNDSNNRSDTVMDFVQHVIKEYDGRDSYKGLGHLKGTVKITDPETIESIMDERYLTVSTSMVSDSAQCSVCGVDWVKDGLCEHNRGQVYDDDVCVVVPGSMAYDHLGIVNTPADPHAHNFTIVGDSPTESTILQIGNSAKEDLYKVSDKYDIAAELFGCNDSSIVSLSSETDINLIEIKDNIQKMENAMKLITDRIKDAMDVKVEVYRFGNGDTGSKEVTVREYMEELDTEGLQSMIAQIAKMIESEDSAEITDEELKTTVDKYFSDNYEAIEVAEEEATEDSIEEDETEEPEHGYFGDMFYGDEVVHKGAEGTEVDKKKCKKKKKSAKKMSDNFKLVNDSEITVEMIKDEVEGIVKVENHLLDSEKIVELAELISLYKNEDAFALSVFNWEDKTYEEMISDFKEYTDTRIEFANSDSEEVYSQMKLYMDEEKILSDEAIKELKSSDFCGVKGFFPVIDEAHAKAALVVLSKCIATDSVKSRIFTSIHRKAKRLGLDLTDNFDSNEEPCNNNASISVEEAVKAYEDAKGKLEELGVEIPGLETVVVDTSDKDQEIEILEAQLEAINEELDQVVGEFNKVQLQLAEELATRTVDMKMLSGNFEINDRVVEIEEHKKRDLVSLMDTLKDLESQVKIEDLAKDDGMSGTPIESVEDPTLQSQDSKAGSEDDSRVMEEDRKFKLYDEYNKRVTTYGKREADKWLSRVQRQNGSIPTID